MSLVYYAIKDSGGSIVRQGACDSTQAYAQANAGETVVILSQPAGSNTNVVIGTDAPSLDPTTGSTVKIPPNGSYIDLDTGQAGTVNTGYVLSKPYNSCAVDKTTFKANSGTTAEGIVTITGVADNAKVDIIPAPGICIDAIYDYVVLQADHTIQITTSEAGQYTVDIDDGTTTHYRVILNATL